MNWDEYKAAQKKEKQENHERAMATFDDAQDLARENNWRLFRCSDIHFKLTCGNWIYHLYPSNQRIYADPTHHRGPFLNVTRPWTFLDIVEAAIEKLKPNKGILSDSITN